MADKSTPFDRDRIDPRLDYIEALRMVNRDFGKGYGKIIREIVGLARGEGKISPYEYFAFRLYDDNAFTEDEKSSFLGAKAVRKYHRDLFDQHWMGASLDKLLFYSVMEGQKLPIPGLQAVYHPYRQFGDCPNLTDRDALRGFLANDARYPAFSKPAYSVNSLGVAKIEGFERGSDRLRLSGGLTVPFDRFADEADHYADHGYIIQDLVEPSEAALKLVGDRLPAVRVVILLEDDGPRIERASWKIPCGDNVADNFWRQGNLLAAIETETGVVQRVVQGIGPTQREIENHPDTGSRLVGAEIPDWHDVKNLALRGANTMSGLIMQGWDIAVAKGGPVILEVEGDGGSPLMGQLPQAQGLLSPEFRAFIARHHAKRKQTIAEHRKKRRARLRASMTEVFGEPGGGSAAKPEADDQKAA